LFLGENATKMKGGVETGTNWQVCNTLSQKEKKSGAQRVQIDRT